MPTAAERELRDQGSGAVRAEVASLQMPLSAHMAWPAMWPRRTLPVAPVLQEVHQPG